MYYIAIDIILLYVYRNFDSCKNILYKRSICCNVEYFVFNFIQCFRFKVIAYTYNIIVY